MTLIENTKYWIAEHFGSFSEGYYCYEPNKIIPYTDPAGIAQSGSTADIVLTLVIGHLVGNPQGPNGETYNDMTTENGGAEITVDDVLWVSQNDGLPITEPQFCYIYAICKYILDNGGWNNLVWDSVLNMLWEYVNPAADYVLFDPTWSETLGTLWYYVGNLTKGNEFTGCGFM